MELFDSADITAAISNAFTAWVLPNIAAILAVTFIGVALSIVLTLIYRPTNKMRKGR